MKQYIKDMMPDISGFLKNNPVFFAFGGTITTLSKITLRIPDFSKTENTLLKKESADLFLREISALTDTQIGSAYAPFLDNGRETVIRAGTIIFQALLEYLRQPHALVTNQGVLYGILSERFQYIQKNNCTI